MHKLLILMSSLFLASTVFADSSLHFNNQILVDSSGMTVYVFDKDVGSESTCYGNCAKVWPPVPAPQDGSALPADVTSIERRDGTHQLAYKGRPVYYFNRDSQPGDKNGDGLGGVWHVISE